MNKQMLKGKWNELKGETKQKWGQLTDDDVDQINGSYDKLVGTLQQKYGKSKEEAEKEVEDWQKNG